MKVIALRNVAMRAAVIRAWASRNVILRTQQTVAALQEQMPGVGNKRVPNVVLVN